MFQAAPALTPKVNSCEFRVIAPQPFQQLLEIPIDRHRRTHKRSVGVCLLEAVIREAWPRVPLLSPEETWALARFGQKRVTPQLPLEATAASDSQRDAAGRQSIKGRSLVSDDARLSLLRRPGAAIQMLVLIGCCCCCWLTV